MLNNWLTLRALAAELDERYRGARIVSCFSQERDELMLELDVAGKIEHLHFSAGRTIFIAPHPAFARARRNSAEVFEQTVGAQITVAAVALDDRVVEFLFDDGRRLRFVLFRKQAGASLFSAEGHCVDAFKHGGREGAWTFGNDLPFIEYDEFTRNIVADPDRELTAALRALRPWCSGVFASELCHRADLDPRTPCVSLTSAQHRALAMELGAMLEESGRGRAYVYFRDGVPAHTSPVELRHLAALDHVETASVADAVFLHVRKSLAAGSEAGLRRRVEQALEKETQRLARALSRLVPPDEVETRAAEYEKFGNLLMIHMHDYPEQPNQMTVSDIFTDPRLVVSIPIREGVSILENAQRYFEKSKHARSSVAYVRSRMAYLHTRTEQLLDCRRALGRADSLRAIKTLLSEHQELMRSIGLTVKGDTDERPFPFRRFFVSGGFEVWAGKNSANNDELTVRHARPNDIWFHARGVGGSHVVLRVPGASAVVPKEAIREAASIAAYYSKHRKAKSVLVAYTEKKYVRKPRGVPAGTVYLEREKTINAEPRLPASAEAELESEGQE